VKRLLALVSCLCVSVAFGKDYRVVFFGDSITSGWKLWGNLTQFAPWAFDAGVPGNTSRLMLARIQTDVLAHHPQIVVLLAGTNDTDDAQFLNQPLDFSYMREIVQQCEAAGAQLIVGTIPPAPEAKWNEYVERWNAEVKLESTVYGYQVVDYYPMFFPGGKKDLALFESDVIHPSYAGFLRMSVALGPLLRGDEITQPRH
jgi:acyl-CoA thioesterase I